MQAQGVFQLVWRTLFAGLSVSLVTSLLVVATKRWHGAFRLHHTSGVQKFYITPTPRSGGLVIICGGLAAWLLLCLNFH